ncbi:MAG TPA: ThuA domain-containing protein [Acidimicrobiales bacterium]|nr:ThuA domain-containing protein [Acidimicrobiales bacterium]
MGDSALRVLVITGGHPFQAEPFFQIFDADDGIVWAHAAQPGARRWLARMRPGEFDALVFYDMPGVGLDRGRPPQPETPPDDLVAGMRALLDGGQGVVFLHHAIASWPAWDEYAQWVGGRFLYRPGSLAGRDWPDSGYAFDVTHHLSPVDPDHPVLRGLAEGLTLTDELYLAPVLEDQVVPLLRSDAVFTEDRFWSSAAAISGRRDSRDGWHHPPGSDLAAWAKRARRSPVVYLQPGDGPSAYADPGWRRLLANAIRWVASQDAHNWAAGSDGG